MKIVNKMKKKQNKKIKGNTRFGSSCKYRLWDGSNKSGFYIWGVEENIAATLK